MQLLLRIYASLLNLYPREFLDEFREELQTVFDLSLRESNRIGKMDVAAAFSRELIGLPKAVLHEHLRQRRKTRMIKRLNARFDFAPGSYRETLAALMPLTLSLLVTSGMSMLYFYITGFSRAIANAIGYVLVGLFFILLLAALLKGFPRWSMPYLGLLLAPLSVYQFSGVIYAHYGSYPSYERSWILDMFVTQVYLWSGLTLVVLLLVTASAIFPVFYKVRRDWTLLSFLVYGAAPFAILIAFNEYQLKDPYLLMIFVVQLLGVWFYLHAHGKWKRFLVLFVALTLSMWIVSIGRMIVLPSQTWTHTLAPDYWKNELLGPVPVWIWLSLTMLIPSVISLFPRVRKTTVIESSA